MCPDSFCLSALWVWLSQNADCQSVTNKWMVFIYIRKSHWCYQFSYVQCSRSHLLTSNIPKYVFYFLKHAEYWFCWIETLLKGTNSCFFRSVGAWAGGVWEGERRVAGVRQLCSAADCRLLPRYPGAGCQCPGGVVLTTLTSDTTRLAPGLHITCSRVQAPLPPLYAAHKGWDAAGASSHPIELLFFAPFVHPGTNVQDC